MKYARAFAPGNVSCIFVIRKTKNPAKSGSLGVGFTVNKGVVVKVKKIDNNKTTKKITINNKVQFKIKNNNQRKNNKIENNQKNNKKLKNKNIKNKKNGNQKNIIYFNSKKINFPTVNSVIDKLTNEKFIVNIESELPLGSGFGLSGASAIATAYAINKLLNLKKTKKQLALIAHVAEVENMTGLGDVVNQYYGGFLVKYKPSYMFKVKKIPIKNKKIYYRYFSGINTKKIISDKKIKNRINNAGIDSLNKVKKLRNKDLNLKNLIKISKEFSSNSGLLRNKNIINVIKKTENKNGSASMIMLGNAVFSDTYFKGSKELIIKDGSACLL